MAMLCRSACRPGTRRAVEGPITSSRRLLIRHRAQWPGWGWSGSLQVGQSSQAAGAVQSPQSGWVRVPETIGAWWPQFEQAAVRRWQVGHQGRPVAREMPQGVASPQIDHANRVSLGHLGQSGHAGVR